MLKGNFQQEKSSCYILREKYQVWYPPRLPRFETDCGDWNAWGLPGIDNNPCNVCMLPRYGPIWACLQDVFYQCDVSMQGYPHFSRKNDSIRASVAFFFLFEGIIAENVGMRSENRDLNPDTGEEYKCTLPLGDHPLPCRWN